MVLFELCLSSWLIISVHNTESSFGTACNVTGDGAIEMVIDRIAGKNINITTKWEAEDEKIIHGAYDLLYGILFGAGTIENG